MARRTRRLRQLAVGELDAGQERRQIRIDYVDANGAGSRRQIEPLLLAYWGYGWTLAGWCELRAAFRDFRVVISDQTQDADPVCSSEVRSVIRVLESHGIAAMGPNAAATTLRWEVSSTDPFKVYVRRADCEILDTWHAGGLRGTGSHDVVVELSLPDAATRQIDELREALQALRDHNEREEARHVPFEAAVRKHYPIVAAAAVLVLLVTVLTAVPQLPLWALVLVIFGMGVSGGHMVISFALAREVSHPGLHGSVMGLVNAMTVASGAVLQPVIGALLDMLWDGRMAGGVRIYQASDYRLALASLVAWTAMGLVASLFLRETRCRPVNPPPVRP